ncbi:hypothetical protein VdG2_06740 [Verticillium dahliae VDG2]|nr:hypothetical protein VdG2_06740 [Verticillium dahliae VDG2]
MRVSCVFQALAAVALVSAVALPDPRPADNDALNVSSDLKAATEPEDADAVAKANGLLKPIEDDINIYIYDRKGRRISRYGKDKKVLESEAEKTPKEKEEAEREMNRKKAEWAASDKKKAADAKKKLEKQKAKEEKAVRDKKYQDEMHARKKAMQEALKKAGMTKTVKQRRAECIKNVGMLVELPPLWNIMH